MAQDSHSSSKPPSSDGLGRSPKTPNLRKAAGKKSGRQSAHLGQTLSQTPTLDHLVLHSASTCYRCQMPLAPTEFGPVAERRQVWHLLPQKLEVTEHCSLVTPCPAGGETNLGSFPPVVTSPLQYGPHLRAMAVYLTNYQLLPYARTTQVLDQWFGCHLSQGTLAQFLQECYAPLETPEQIIKTALCEVAVLYNDETGLFVEAIRRWLHTACTSKLTHYAWHNRRGKAATDDIAIPTAFRTSVSTMATKVTPSTSVNTLYAMPTIYVS